MMRHWVKLVCAASLGAFAVLGASMDASAQNWVKKYDGVEYTSYNGLHAVRIDLDLVGVNITPKISVKRGHDAEEIRGDV